MFSFTHLLSFFCLLSVFFRRYISIYFFINLLSVFYSSFHSSSIPCFSCVHTILVSFRNLCHIVSGEDLNVKIGGGRLGCKGSQHLKTTSTSIDELLLDETQCKFQASL